MSDTYKNIMAKLELLSASKDDISAAIEEKSISVSNIFIDYGNRIQQIDISPDENLKKYIDKTIENINLSIDMEEIRPYAFADCENLASITILSSVKKIGQNAFLGCNSLTTVHFKNEWTGSSNYIGLPYDTEYEGDGISILSATADNQISNNAWNVSDDFGNYWRFWIHGREEYSTIALRRNSSNDRGRSRYTLVDKSNIYVPDIVKGYPCRTLGNYYFYIDSDQDYYDYESLQRFLSASTVNISQHIRSIQKWAFEGARISKVNFLLNEPAEAVDFDNFSLAEHCFRNNLISEFEFPRGHFGAIENSILESNTNLYRIENMPEITRMESFFGYSKISSFTIPDSVISCRGGDACFYNLPRLERVVVGANVRDGSGSYFVPYFRGTDLSSLKEIVYRCPMSAFSYENSYGYTYYKIGNLSGLTDIYFENPQMTLSYLSSRYGIHSLNLKSTVKFHAYDAVVDYSNKLNAPHTIISALPNSIL